jgi:hypothetical protein
MYRESGSDEKHKYFRSLLISMRAYIKKVHERIDKYKGRGVVFNEDNITLFDSLVNSVKSHIVVNIDTAENTLNFVHPVQTTNDTVVTQDHTNSNNNVNVNDNSNVNDSGNNSNVNDSDSDIDGIDRLVNTIDDLLDLNEYENTNVSHTNATFSQMGTVGILLDDVDLPPQTNTNINLVNILTDVFSFEEPKQKID